MPDFLDIRQWCRQNAYQRGTPESNSSIQLRPFAKWRHRTCPIIGLCSIFNLSYEAQLNPIGTVGTRMLFIIMRIAWQKKECFTHRVSSQQYIWRAPVTLSYLGWGFQRMTSKSSFDLYTMHNKFSNCFVWVSPSRIISSFICCHEDASADHLTRVCI